MCGHVGIAGNLAFRDEALFDRMLLFDVFRGIDSTGLAVIRKGGEALIAKAAVNPLELFEMKRYTSIRTAATAHALIGHNRAATRGKISSHNAHPYAFGSITGAHNGTLNIPSVKTLNEINGEEFGTDSMALFCAIDKVGIEEVIPNIETCKESAWSLVWHDSKDHSLNFLRNKERPMMFGFSDKFDRVLWGSEWPIMSAAVNTLTNPYDLYKEPKTNHQYWPTTVDAWYKFDLKELAEGYDKMPIPIQKTLTGKEPKTVSYGGSGSPFGGSTCSGHMGQSTTTTHLKTSFDSNDGVIHLFGTDEEPLAGYMNKEDFDEMTEYGCQWCGGELLFSQQGHSLYEKEQIAVCRDCAPNDRDQTRIYVKDFPGNLVLN